MVIRIQRVASLIYSQSGAVHLWIPSKYRQRQDFRITKPFDDRFGDVRSLTPCPGRSEPVSVFLAFDRESGSRLPNIRKYFCFLFFLTGYMFFNFLLLILL